MFTQVWNKNSQRVRIISLSSLCILGQFVIEGLWMEAANKYIGVLKVFSREFWNLITSTVAAKETKKIQASLSSSMERDSVV